MTFLEVSTNIHFICDPQNQISTTRTEKQISELFQNVDNIWAPAEIKFKPIMLPREENTIDQLAIIMDTYLTTSLEEEYDKIDVYFVSNVKYNSQLFNGWTNRKLRRVFINDFLTKDFDKCVAHEIGHTFQLDHVSDPENLMFEFSNGKNLSDVQIKTARTNAEFSKSI